MKPVLIAAALMAPMTAQAIATWQPIEGVNANYAVESEDFYDIYLGVFDAQGGYTDIGLYFYNDDTSDCTEWEAFTRDGGSFIIEDQRVRFDKQCQGHQAEMYFPTTQEGTDFIVNQLLSTKGTITIDSAYDGGTFGEFSTRGFTAAWQDRAL
uniref:hypothetical protein n=1 Tax=Thaumasiovibrio occultus TaxID=1891184 RepID=UPI00131B2A1B|nr:hypothetical protein [Thaumasiovibrio occultus]